MSADLIRMVTLMFRGGHTLDVVMRQADAYAIREALINPEARATYRSVHWVGAPDAPEDVLDRELSLDLTELLYILY